MNVYLIALLCGVVAGLRAFMPVAAVSWAASSGRLQLAGTWLSFLGATATPWITSPLAALELVTDKLPNTPSRKVPPQFGARLISGAFTGAAVGAGSGAMLAGAALGVAGAVAGTYGGAALRGTLARAFGRDLPAALIEDILAISGAALIVAFAGNQVG